MTAFIVLSILLVIFVSLSGFLSWYAYNSIKKFQSMTHSIEMLDLGLVSFEKHLKWLYEMEMYYGDETLESLLTHSRDITDSFADFRKDYEIFNGDIDEKEFFEDEDNAAEKENSGEDLLFQRS